MFKMLLCIVIVTCATLIGFSYSSKLYKRKAVLQNFVLELRKCSTQMRYVSPQLSQIFSDNFMNYNFSDSMPFYSQWTDMLDGYSDVLSKNDIATLNAFAKNLGTTDTIGELNNIELYTEMLEKNIENAQNDIDKKSKLYKTLGLSAGITVSILLI